MTTRRQGPIRARVSNHSTFTTLTGLAALLALPSAANAVVVYSDGTFSTSVWGFEFVGSGTATPAQIASGGNPGTYRRITQTVTANSGWFYAFSRYGTNTATRYDPVTQGAINSVDFSIQAQTISVINGQVPGLAMGIKQGSLVYVQSAFQNIGGPAWNTFSSAALTPADFFCANGAGTLDFSASGAAIRFGFVTINASFSVGVETGGVTEYDNFNATVNQVPAPAGIALLGIGGLLAARRRR